MASANLLNSTENTENFGFYRHDNFFYEFRKNHTCPKDDWNIFLGRPYQNLLVSDERTSAKVRPCRGKDKTCPFLLMQDHVPYRHVPYA